VDEGGQVEGDPHGAGARAPLDVPAGAERVERALGWTALCLALAAAAIAGWDALSTVGYNPLDDEGVYRSFVQRIDRRGWSAYPSLFEEFNTTPERWMSPLPSRIGYVAVVWIAARFAELTLPLLSAISFVAHLSSIAVGFAFVRSRTGTLAGGLFALGLASSPLLARLAVQPMTDSLALLLTLASTWSWLALLSRPSRARLAGFVAAFTATLLVKELCGVLALSFAAMAWMERRRGHSALAWSDVGFALAVPVVACVSASMIAAQSVVAPLQMFRTALASLEHNPYVFEHYGQPWYASARDLFVLSPLASLAALAGLVVALSPRTRDALGSSFAPFALALFVAAAFMGHNIRYFAALELPLRYLAVAAVLILARKVARPVPAIWIAGAALCIVAASDVWSAQTTFRQLYDPTSATLLEMRGW
jgi:hypothetical protein